MINKLINKLRMWDWWMLAIVCLVSIAMFAPQQLMVVLYKFSLVSFSGVTAYWIDRSLFKDVGRLKDFVNNSPLVGWRMLARSLVFVGVVLGLTLGI